MIGIADDLAGPVIGDVAAAAGFEDLDAARRQRSSGVARMCDRPPSPRTPSVRTGGCSTSSSRSPTRPARRSLDQRALQRQRVRVAHQTETPSLERTSWLSHRIAQPLPEYRRNAMAAAQSERRACPASSCVAGSQFSSCCLMCDMNSSATAPSMIR